MSEDKLQINPEMIDTFMDEITKALEKTEYSFNQKVIVHTDEGEKEGYIIGVIPNPPDLPIFDGILLVFYANNPVDLNNKDQHLSLMLTMSTNIKVITDETH